VEPRGFEHGGISSLLILLHYLTAFTALSLLLLALLYC
jgi:hypothetical protein